MENPKSERKQTVPCDYCSERVAVIYCRADSAKLCLFCDQLVHSANSLSKKHVRSQICDNCGNEPVTVRCSTDNLVLCKECDWDAHGSCSVSAAHDRIPIEGLSGCPSALELASIWGFDLQDKKFDESEPLCDDLVMQTEPWVFDKPDGGSGGGGVSYFHDLIVPNGKGTIFGNMSYSDVMMASKRQQNPSCGRFTHVIFKQLMELFRRNSVSGDNGGEDSVSGTTIGQGINDDGNNVEGKGGDFVNGIDGGGGVITEQEYLQEEAGFTSLLMMPSHMDLKSCGDGVVSNEGHVMCECTVNAHGTQIWDFNLGQLRTPDQSEVAYGTSNAGFTIKNFGKLMKETSSSDTKMLGDLYQINSSSAHDDMTLFNSYSNNPTTSRGLAASESDNLSFVKLKDAGGCNDIGFNEQKILIRGDDVRTVPPNRADMELLAKNRGTAMQRYIEKKKNRRFDKHIRYESRKARADTRKRVKGRFVKACDAPYG